MDDIAAKVGLDFIVNTVLDDDGNMLAVFAGHYIEAHKAACNFAEKLQIIRIPAKADILITSANPCHFDFWQGLKPYIYSHLAVREGGVIIFLLDGAEGLCGDAPSHEETLRKYLLWSFEDQKAAVNRGEVKDLVGIHAAMHHSQVRNRVKKTFCVTNHISPEDLAALGFDTAPSIQKALKMAYKLLGPRSKSRGNTLWRGDSGTAFNGRNNPYSEEYLKFSTFNDYEFRADDPFGPLYEYIDPAETISFDTMYQVS